MKKIALVSLVLALGACGPRDVALKGGRNSNNGGNQEAVIGLASKKSEKLDSCSGDRLFTYVNSPIELDGRIFAGKITAQWQTGDFNCFRVGDEVTLQNNTSEKKNEPVRAKLIIKKLQVLDPDDITSAHAKAVAMPLEALKEKVKAAVSANEKSKGVVNFTFFEVVEGSFDTSVIKPSDKEDIAVDAAEGEEGTDVAAGPGYIKLISKVGERSPTCPVEKTDFTNIISPAANDPLVLAGELKAIIEPGERNCYRIGQILAFKEDTKKGTKQRDLKALISQVQIVPLDQLNDSHATALNMTLEELQEYAAELNENVKKNPKPFPTNNTVNITFFELVEVQVQQAKPQAQQAPVPDTTKVNPPK